MQKSFFYSALSAIALIGVSNAATVHFADYETETGAALGVTPNESQFVGGGGDHVGTAALGIADVNPRGGTYNYVIENTTADNGNGWGGTWSGVSSLGGTPGTTVTTQADALANATPANPLSYVDVTAGTTFSVSAWVATDATTPLTGTVVTNVRLEFKDASGTEIFRNDNGASLNAAALTTTYQEISHSYTLTAADIAAGVTNVTAVYGSDGHGFANGDGLIYMDDFLFEVDNASFITVIPEPGTTALALLGLLGVAVRRRR